MAAVVMEFPEPSTPPLLRELAQVPGHVLWRAAAKVTLELGAALPPRLEVHGYASLLALASGGARSQQWLADTIAVSRTTMTNVVTVLVDQGLVERARNPEDKRSYVLTRTEKGAEAAAGWRHAESLERHLGEGLAPAERTELRTLLLQVLEPVLAPGTPDELRESLGFLITRLHARVHADGLAALRDLDLEPRFMGSLIVLRKLGPIPQSELALHLGISHPTVVEIVDSLEGQGLVQRRRDERDRRTQRLHLTERARPVGDAARTRLRAVTDHYLGVLTTEERERLLELLVTFVNGG